MTEPKKYDFQIITINDLGKDYSFTITESKLT